MDALKLLTPRAGLRVLVTGGASGIGLAIAKAFVATGARVHVCDVDGRAIDALATETPAITGTRANVADQADVARVFDDLQRELGGLDVLINNAGIAGPTGGIDAIEASEWEKTVSVNLNSHFYFSRLAVPLLRQAPDGGVIVFISSVAGRLGYGFRTPYSATKWAVVGLAKSLAIELGPDNIRVNAVQPGIVKGPRMEGVIAARAKQLGLTYEEMEARYLEKISLRRMVTQDEVAASVLFLSSPAGSAISGQALSVCGNVETL
ncbi:D-beta-hydroxybutyrate dehydrogenase [Caballeronia glathei]|jgi:NAD(P)-dependent dehydrogenase (short-subunit alcohol dehydrogenase family)|uniref:3-ketoacyl-ACP reductase n=1 Tax=Caballeronia glathei TaxID=60547 RepID=A0A069PFR6_9BURK|nr:MULTISPECIES: SDR family oxidoreductase [Burkholderiaceae]KDR39538.1 3-ketoacyl-ACP reductase [Caballeronia glathei]TCK38196.1 NAD(P)-dependent dehydrogenase (short-subunit alcohol dehydrogenase family) [Paraburkholderia sp. BL8N3]CDY78229.1 D-beta-hydroxybutyrate dehydrogenase [Caballeronia glathei]